MRRHPQYIAKKRADEPSFLWDRLIKIFTEPMLEGTTIVPEDDTFDIGRYEIGVRQLALVPRYKRRHLGAGIKEALEISPEHRRFVRAFLPAPEDRSIGTAHFFMTLAVPDPLPEGGYEQYRKVRTFMLQTYAMAYLRMDPRLPGIAGIATEPIQAANAHGHSEDMIYIPRPEWTPELLAQLAEDQERFDVLRPERIRTRPVTGDEFPQVEAQQPRVRPITMRPPPMNRAQRRAATARARRRP
jgi:hypothetical protein